MQSWTLARYLPLIIGDKIPEDSIYWETFLTLLDILDICFSPKVSTEQATYLANLIELHHESYKEAYPDKKLIPKQHYMIHYPDSIKRYEYMAIYTSILRNIYTYILQIYIILQGMDHWCVCGACALKQSIVTSRKWPTH